MVNGRAKWPTGSSRPLGTAHTHNIFPLKYGEVRFALNHDDPALLMTNQYLSMGRLSLLTKLVNPVWGV